MPQEDLLMRYFNEFARFLATMIGLREQGETQKELQRLEEFLNDNFPVDFSEIVETENDKLSENLLSKGFSIVQMNMLGDLLYEFALAKKEEALYGDFKAALTKAELLLHYVDDNDQVFSIPRMEKLSEIRELINRLDI